MDGTDQSPEQITGVIEDDPEIRPKMNTGSSFYPDEQLCPKCPQLEQTLDNALAMIHDLLAK